MELLRKTVSGIMLTLLFIGTLTPAFNLRLSGAQPATIVVPDDYPTIQEAIDAANPGDTIYVRSGIYEGNVYVSKSLSLIGECKNTTVIVGDGRGNVVDIVADNVVISRFSIKHAGNYFSGIFLENSSSSFVFDNNVEDNYYGVKLYNCSNCLVFRNNATNNRWGHIVLDSSHNCSVLNNFVAGNWMGIYLLNCSDCSISRNIIAKANGSGIELEHSSGCSISRNHAYNSDWGICMRACDACFILGNIVENNSRCDIQLVGCSGCSNERNTAGVQLVGCSNCSISSNVGYISVQKSSGCSLHSNFLRFLIAFNNSDICFSRNIVINKIVDLTQAYDWSISDNILVNTTITFYGSNNCSLFGNIFKKCNLSIGTFKHPASNNKIYHNIFVNSTVHVETGTINIWDDGYPSGGNYWSDYAGVDMYSGPYQNETGSDGIGDTPYVIEKYNQDNYPIMTPPEFLDKYLRTLSTYYVLNATYESQYVRLCDYDVLLIAYYDILTNYDLLNSSYNSLNAGYNSLNASYNEVNTRLDATISELNDIRNLMYVFITTTVILATITAYFVVRRKTNTKTQKMDIH